MGPAQNTRPNSRDLAPAHPMCPNFRLERRKIPDIFNGETIKRQSQPRQDSFSSLPAFIELQLEVRDQIKEIRDIEIFLL